jgi:hypothetical protein
MGTNFRGHQLKPGGHERGTLFYCVIRDTSAAKRCLQRWSVISSLRVLSELSAKFINLPADRVDEEITSACRYWQLWIMIEHTSAKSTLPPATFDYTRGASVFPHLRSEFWRVVCRGSRHGSETERYRSQRDRQICRRKRVASVLIWKQLGKSPLWLCPIAWPGP